MQKIKDYLTLQGWKTDLDETLKDLSYKNLSYIKDKALEKLDRAESIAKNTCLWAYQHPIKISAKLIRRTAKGTKNLSLWSWKHFPKKSKAAVKGTKKVTGKKIPKNQTTGKPYPLYAKYQPGKFIYENRFMSSLVLGGALAIYGCYYVAKTSIPKINETITEYKTAVGQKIENRTTNNQTKQILTENNQDKIYLEERVLFEGNLKDNRLDEWYVRLSEVYDPENEERINVLQKSKKTSRWNKLVWEYIYEPNVNKITRVRRTDIFSFDQKTAEYNDKKTDPISSSILEKANQDYKYWLEESRKKLESEF